ncbi:MAG: sulfatase-like hydrolase/transferase [Anaeromyxobacter sp.]
MSRWSTLAFFLALVAHGLTVSAASAKPNLVLILADDLGYETVGANGGTSYKTPVLDKLAADGMRFTRCFAQPLCTPTRVQLMTGLYNVRNYIHFGALETSQITFGNLLKKAGYATAIAGKWQLGREVDLPQKFGFDESYLWQHTRRPARYANPGIEHNGKELDFSKGEYGPDLVNDFAIDFITRKKDQAVPPLLHDDADARPVPADALIARTGIPSALGEKRRQVAAALRRHGHLHGQADRQTRPRRSTS